MFHPGSFWTELLWCALMGFGGVSLTALFGAKSPSKMSAGALVSATPVLCLAFILGASLGVSPSQLAALFLIALVSGALLFKPSKTLLYAYGCSGLLTIAGVGTYRFSPLPQRAGEDPLQIMEAAFWAISRGIFPDSPRHGFAIPLLIGSTPDGTLANSVSSILFLSLFVLLVGEVRGYMRASDSRTGLFVHAIVASVWLSTPIIILMVTYVNGHVLMAICLTILFSGSHRLLRTGELTLPKSFELVAAALTTSLCRVEGSVVVALLLALVLIKMPVQFADENHRFFVVLFTPALTSTIWIGFTNSSSAVFYSLPLILTLLPLLGRKVASNISASGKSTLAKNVPLLLAILGLLMVVLSNGHGGLQLVVWTQFLNLILGVSGWGLVFPITLLFLWSARKVHLSSAGYLKDFLLWGLSGQFFLKTLEGLPAAQGFNDSLSRTLIHFVGPMFLLWIVQIMDWVYKTQRRA